MIGDGDCETAMVASGETFGTKNDVGLLGVSMAEPHPRGDYGSDPGMAHRRTLPIPHVLGDQVHDLLVLEVTNSGNNRRLRCVATVPVVVDRVPAHVRNRLFGAQYGRRQGMISPEGGHKLLMSDVTRIILVHVDLLEDNVAFRVDLMLPESGTLQHLGQDVHGKRQIGTPQSGPVAGVLLTGESVVPGADGVECLRDGSSRESLRAFEQQVLEEVAAAGLDGPVSTQAPIATERTESMTCVMIRRPLGSVVRS